MKKKFLLLFVAMMAISSSSCFAQSYDDYFTTYTPVEASPYDPVYVAPMPTMDVDKLLSSFKKQNSKSAMKLQVITGVRIKQGQMRTIKLKVGVTELGNVVVKAYYNNRQWWTCSTRASSNPLSIPEELKDMCEYEAYITGVGKVYF